MKFEELKKKYYEALATGNKKEADKLYKKLFRKVLKKKEKKKKLSKYIWH